MDDKQEAHVMRCYPPRPINQANQLQWITLSLISIILHIILILIQYM